jgi:excisionase family DNA binding protein
MSDKIFSVDDISSILDMHPKTVQRYIREGRIKATKLGKAWRVSEYDFNAFLKASGLDTTHSARPKATDTHQVSVNRYDLIKVSSVVDISVKNTEDAIKIANILTATINGQHEEYGKSSLNIQFIEPENKVRVMLWGNIKFMENMMHFISSYVENYVGQ